MDEQQVISDALDALRQVQEGFRGERVAGLAGSMSELIRPTMAFDTSLEEARRRREKLPKEFAEESAEIVSRNRKCQLTRRLCSNV